MTKIVNGIDGSHLKSYIERIETLEENKKSIAEDIKAVFDEAKAFGFDIKIIREVIKIRKIDQNELFEKESLIEIYKTALGMTPAEEVDAA